MAVSTPDVARAAEQLAWDKTFPQSDKVIHQKVSFNNRLGINLVADLYIPKNLDRSKKHPAIVVGGPYGAVKEQSAGLYAQTMAERGFVGPYVVNDGATIVGLVDVDGDGEPLLWTADGSRNPLIGLEEESQGRAGDVRASAV